MSNTSMSNITGGRQKGATFLSKKTIFRDGNSDRSRTKSNLVQHGKVWNSYVI